MDQNIETSQLTIERGTIVKIDGLAKRLNINLTIIVPVDFFDKHDILPED